MAEPFSDSKKEKEDKSLPFYNYKLFSFADRYDYFLMISGSLGVVVHGSSMPVFFLLFGQMVNGFGKNQSDFKKMTEQVSQYALYFVYLGLVVCFSSYAEIACWMYTGERQSNAIRKKYQDVGFFDTHESGSAPGFHVFGRAGSGLQADDKYLLRRMGRKGE